MSILIFIKNLIRYPVRPVGPVEPVTDKKTGLTSGPVLKTLVLPQTY